MVWRFEWGGVWGLRLIPTTVVGAMNQDGRRVARVWNEVWNLLTCTSQQGWVFGLNLGGPWNFNLYTIIFLMHPHAFTKELKWASSSPLASLLIHHAHSVRTPCLEWVLWCFGLRGPFIFYCVYPPILSFFGWPKNSVWAQLAAY